MIKNIPFQGRFTIAWFGFIQIYTQTFIRKIRGHQFKFMLHWAKQQKILPLKLHPAKGVRNFVLCGNYMSQEIKGLR